MAEAFSRIVCGVDGSAASLEALRQAVVLRAPDGELSAVVACDLGAAAQTGFGASAAATWLEDEAVEARTAAAEVIEGVPFASAEIVRGRPVAALTAALERQDADLLVVGSHGRGRVASLVFGSVASELLHAGRWTTLLARQAADEGTWRPREFVVGTDGSPRSLAALAVARELADRLGALLRVVVATGGKVVEAEGLARLDDLEWDQRDPVTALVETARAADLLVVGSRGLHGLRALGSVSERAAHRAACSVLVVHGSGDPET
jgi:nucleotide-binding universal stress UspA family protein